MEQRIKVIMQEYIKGVENICNNLLDGINHDNNLNLKTKRDFFVYREKQKKWEYEYEINGISYRWHGIGCFAFNKDFWVEWDFGYRSRWCGIDPWKLASTLKRNRSQYIEYYDGNTIKEICEQAVEEGIMFRKGEHYYFQIPKNETFEPRFPKEFDTLVVKYHDSTWSISRNKVIDKFIRKSRWVYNQIDKNEDRYILKFMLDGAEVYSILYDDTGYPESAIKIMSDDILHNLCINRNRDMDKNLN